MDRQYPVYTVETECQDCYKCVRHCPAKAIKVRDGHAAVIPERCVACGQCVEVCPARAKHIRDDVGRARHLLRSGRPVYVSLAPSWVGEFPELDASRMIAAIRALGFEGVGETALGAQEVSTRIVQDYESSTPGLRLSSACPAAVAYVQKYLPQLHSSITPLASPLLTHARLLRAHFGDDIAIVFIGPCVAKKIEADNHPELLQLALTFSDLRRMWRESEIDPSSFEAEPNDAFVPDTAEEGSLYPIVGGMLDSLRIGKINPDVELLDLTGLRQMDHALTGLDPDDLDRPVFIECLACEGGCVGGPCMSQEHTGLMSRLEVRSRAKTPEHFRQRPLRVASDAAIPSDAVCRAPLSEERIRDALLRVGKRTPDDELNCSGCGYESCRQFAAALLEGNAEPEMCVSHMRAIAHKKANALIRCIPLGIVIVNADLRVIECNKPFAEMFGEETESVFDVQPGLSDAVLGKIIPCEDLFRTALRTGEDISREHMPVGDQLLNIMIFTIEPHQTVGAVLQDVTEVEFQRERIARQASEVIQKNMHTVQEIACSLGEHMADTEILLNSIASGYGSNSEAHPKKREEKDP